MSLRSIIKRWLFEDSKPQLVKQTDSYYPHDGLSINIQHAVGGYIISINNRSVSTYNNSAKSIATTPDPGPRLYVIPESSNFDEQLLKIITLENLR